MLNVGLFFPTVIGSDHNKELAEYMLPIAKKYLNSSTSTNNLNYKSTYNNKVGIENCPDVKPFLDYINNFAKDYLEKNGYDSEQINLKAKIFVSEMSYGEFHNTHIHPNCVLSGIMYLQTPDRCSPIVFSDPRTEKRMMSLPKISDTAINQLEVSIDPEPGMALIWESWLPHFVPKNYCNESRVTVVFNFSLD